MPQRQQSAVASYLTGLLASGQLVFSREQAQHAIPIGRGAFLDAAEKLQRRRHLFSPRRGFYVVVPPQYLNWGSPPPAWFIDDLMRHEGCPYYVGLLKAAELHGAAHQAVMEFQVVSDKRIPPIRAGRSKMVFYYRKDLSAVSAGIEERNTDTGKMMLSSPELTVLDLLRYTQASAGIDNIITIIGDLGEQLDYRKLASLSGAFERSVVQRLGYLLDFAGFSEKTEPIRKSLDQGPALLRVELEPALTVNSELAPSIIERNARWHVVVRRTPERDE